MEERYEKIKDMTIDEFINSLVKYFSQNNNSETKNQKIYQCIFNKDRVDYKGLYALLPNLDEDDVSIILKYDRDYKITFLLSLVDIAYEEDLTKQAIFLLRRHNLNYIIPLLPYVDEDEIRVEYSKINRTSY